MNLRHLSFALLLTFFACSNEDDGPNLKISPDQLEFIHNGSEKTWRVMEIYEDYGSNRPDEMSACIKDDTYTFFAGSSEVQMNMGEKACYWENPDTQATTLAFNYYPEEGQAYLNHGRSETKEGAFSAILYVMELEEVSANRLFFANGTEKNWGRVLILEAID